MLGFLVPIYGFVIVELWMSITLLLEPYFGVFEYVIAPLYGFPQCSLCLIFLLPLWCGSFMFHSLFHLSKLLFSCLFIFLLCFVQSFTGGLCPFLNHPLCVHHPSSYAVGSVYLFWFALWSVWLVLFCFWTLDSSFSLIKSFFFFPALEFLIL